MNEKLLITCALPYANGSLHFGHLAGTCLPSDVFARFSRLGGKDVHYVCGSDEYGVAITLSAERAGRSPKEHVDHYHKINTELFKKLNFSFTHYSRTTWPGHKEPVQRFFTELCDNGYIEDRITEHLYSEEDQRFLSDRYVVGGCPRCGYESARGDECPKCGASFEATELKSPRSRLTGAPLVLKPSKHWHLHLEKFKEPLKKWLATRRWKSNVINFIEPYIDELKPRAITRDSNWGIPVPLEGAEGKVLYVWFDAPIGYLSASMDWAQTQGDAKLWEKYWLDAKTKLVQFLGKDNIFFHAVTFPAMIMGQNLPIKLVDDMPANEFYNLEGHKLSKSDGWYVDLAQFLEKYSCDQLRYMIAATAPETSDSEFTWREFQLRCNSELVGKFGNFVNRSLQFIHSRMEAKVPRAAALSEEDKRYLEEQQGRLEAIKKAYEGYSLRSATRLLMELCAAGNVYFDTQKPWQLIKEEGAADRLEAVLFACCQTLRMMALAASPIIPESAQKIWQWLGYSSELAQLNWQEVAEQELPVGQRLMKPEVLFQKIEDAVVEEEVKALKAAAEKVHKSEENRKVDLEPLKPEIAFDDFMQVDLRVAQVIEAVAVPKSKKLLKLQVDVGFEKRQVVAGIAQSYAPEELVGQKVVLVANLKPAKICNVESQGMLLAASDGKLFELAGLKSMPLGATVR